MMVGNDCGGHGHHDCGQGHQESGHGNDAASTIDAFGRIVALRGIKQEHINGAPVTDTSYEFVIKAPK